jgi:hypothetical protein
VNQQVKFPHKQAAILNLRIDKGLSRNVKNRLSRVSLNIKQINGRYIRVCNAVGIFTGKYRQNARPPQTESNNFGF